MRGLERNDFRLVLETELNNLDDIELNTIDKAVTDVHVAIWNSGLEIEVIR